MMETPLQSLSYTHIHGSEIAFLKQSKTLNMID